LFNAKINNKKAIKNNDKGCEFIEQGRLSSAEKCFKKAVKLNPNYVEAYNNLGNILQLQGKNDQAVVCLKKAIEIEPDFAQAYITLGNALKQSGEIDEAFTSYQKAISINPDLAEAYASLGSMKKQRGQAAAALEYFNKAIQLKSDDAEVYYNRGKVLYESGQFEAALQSFTQAIEFKPDYFEAYTNCGVLLSGSGQFDKAIASFDKAIQIKPDLDVAYANRGNALSESGQPEAALASYDKAVKLKPDYANAFYNRGNVQSRLGLFEEALESYNEAIRLIPGYAEAYFNRSCLGEYSRVSEAELDFMERQIRRKDLAGPDLKNYYFALANACEQSGDYARQFDLLLEGNHLRRREINYDFSREQHIWTKIKALFPEKTDDIGQPAEQGDSSLTPIFIVGMPRSGTSLIEQIVASHSQAYGAGELTRLRQIVRPMIGTAVKTGMPGNDPGLKNNIENKIRADYLGYLENLNRSEKFITDKMPSNFIFLGFILSAIPYAKIIHVKRSPVAVCWSIFKHNFGGEGNGYGYEMDELAEYYLQYHDLMEFWQTRFPGMIYHLNYEELTENQEIETRRLLDYCGLDWEQGCLDFHTTSRDVKTASQVQVRKKMYQGSSSAWHNYEQQLEPLISKLKSIS
jgi:tetratricopeptide (TPR) repeat protein